MNVRAIVEPPMSTWSLKRGEPDAACRAELGLPLDQPIIMTGHQPGVWHAGVLAKYLAAAAWAKAEGVTVAWVVPDQDEVDPFAIRVPVRDADGRLHERHARLIPGPTREDAAACAFPPASTPAPPPAGLVPPGAADAWRDIAAALVGASEAPNGAAQLSRATGVLMSRWVPPAPTCFGTSVGGTTRARELIARMAADPEACIASYNRAVARHPDARVAPLVCDPVQYRYELPLWWIEPDGRRRRVFAEDLDIEPHRFASPTHPVGLAPRALLMTGILRAWVCDLFIHGVGGARYDLITEAWFHDWLGIELAPMVMVSADAFLALPAGEVREDAAWRAHHARHDPAMLGETELAVAKASMVREIEAMPRRSTERRARYRRLQEMLDSYRARHEAGLRHLADDAARATDARREAALAHDRAWPFPLLEAATLDELHATLSRQATGAALSA